MTNTERDVVEQPWFEQAIRAHEAKYGPCGDNWNISSVLDCLRTAALTASQEPLREAVRTYLDHPMKETRLALEAALNTGTDHDQR